MRSAHFHGPVSLRGAQITENAIFDFAGFDGSIDVGAVHCGGSAYFSDVAINAADRFGPLHATEKISPSNDADHPNLVPVTFEQCLVFVLRSALLLPIGPGFASSTGAEWIQIAARIFGPLLFGLFAFGLRARVRR